MELQEKYAVLSKLLEGSTQHMLAQTAKNVNEVLDEFLEAISCKTQASIGKVYGLGEDLTIFSNICEACTGSLENMNGGSSEASTYISILTKVFTVYKIMLREEDASGKNKELYTAEFLAAAFRTLKVVMAFSDSFDCQTAILSSINNMLISYKSLGLQSDDHYFFQDNCSNAKLTLKSMRHKCSAKYLTVASNIIYRCSALNSKCFEALFVDVITIIVPTLAASVWMLKEQQRQGHPQKDCVGLLLALLRIVHLYGPKYLNATGPGKESNTKKVNEIQNILDLVSMTGIVLMEALSLTLDLQNQIHPVKLSVVRILIDVPEHYLMFLIERKKTVHLLNLLLFESERIMVQNKKDENHVAHNFVPILLVLLRILKIKETTCGMLARKQIKDYIFPERDIGDSIKNEKLHETTPRKTQKTQSMEPTDAPKFTLRRYLIDMLLEFSASTNVIVPLGDLIYNLCDRDGDELIRRCGLGYCAGVLQRQGALGQFMKGVPSNF